MASDRPDMFEETAVTDELDSATLGARAHAALESVRLTHERLTRERDEAVAERDVLRRQLARRTWVAAINWPALVLLAGIFVIGLVIVVGA